MVWESTSKIYLGLEHEALAYMLNANDMQHIVSLGSCLVSIEAVETSLQQPDCVPLHRQSYT